MADVFLSYRNTPDRRAIVRRLATILRAYGVTVWWDYGLEAGEGYRSQIMTELANARIVAPLWCAESVRSPWVRMEAELGKDKLLPGRLQKVPPPDAFEAIQAADLTGWDGAVGSPRLQEFVRLVCKRLDRPAAAPTDLIEELAELPPVKPLPEVAPASPPAGAAGSSHDYASGKRQRLPIMIAIMIVGGLMALAGASIGRHYLGLPFVPWVTTSADLPPKKSPEVQDEEKRAAEAQKRHEEALAAAKRQEEQARIEAEANRRKLEAARAAAELEAVKRRAQEEAEAESRRRKLEAERAAAELEAAQRRRREAAEAERLERARRVQEWRKANGGCDPPLRRQCMTVGPTGGGPQQSIGCVCM